MAPLSGFLRGRPHVGCNATDKAAIVPHGRRGCRDPCCESRDERELRVPMRSRRHQVFSGRRPVGIPVQPGVHFAGVLLAALDERHRLVDELTRYGWMVRRQQRAFWVCSSGSSPGAA